MWRGRAKSESTPFVEFMLEVILESIESSVNTEDKILHYLKQDPNSTIKELVVEEKVIGRY